MWVAYYVPAQCKQPFEDQVLLQLASGSNIESARFSSVESEFDYRLTYDWEDFNKKEFSVSFSLSKKALKEAEDEFGYFPDDLERYVDKNLLPLRKEMIIGLKKITQKLIDKSKYAEHFSIAEGNSDGFNLRVTAHPLLQTQIRDEFKRISADIKRHQTKYLKNIEKERVIQKKNYLLKRGMRFIGDKIGVNYGLLVKNNQDRVKQVSLSMLKKSDSLNFQQFTSYLLSYIQEIRFGIPPLMEKGKYIMGFFVPSRVLINNFGDCDSKGVTYAALWRNFTKYPILLIKIPKHLFIGLAVPSFSEEGVTLNGLRYILCEVTGPDKLPPGMIAPYSMLHFEGGNYSYELIR